MHATNRLSWTRKSMPWTTKSTSIIFSDEKKYNLDGPYQHKFYWYIASRKRKKFIPYIRGGISMVWLAVRYGEERV